MSNQLGMDAGAVKQLATELQRSAEQIEELRGRLDSQLAGVWWQGQDGDQFREQWAGAHTAALKTVAQALSDAGQAANRNAIDQEATSGAL
ncbi:WXG100 family type VII secretion target [Oerskovia jenensis]|uniref:Uncharacterized protein YukE n=1 Tax=Oerskovia jenensis TaxID=162169 RepID=A0ABS2LD68_9CELL|nr:WXG100 family type VII secretion target [Oerskovia jenensis]MBM7478373.1 uncharacterized protein YukE [Oerskovia jenensis]